MEREHHTSYQDHTSYQYHTGYGMSLLADENKMLQARVTSVRRERESARDSARNRDMERERGEGGSRGEMEGGVTLWGRKGGGWGFEGGLLAE
jgi:hypothetical protein